MPFRFGSLSSQPSHARWVPSGDQALHPRERPGAGIGRTSYPLPSVATMAVLIRPSTSVVIDTWLPSGDHRGISCAPSTSRRSPVPSAPMTKTSKSSAAFRRANTIRPSKGTGVGDGATDTCDGVAVASSDVERVALGVDAGADALPALLAPVVVEPQ